MTNNVTRKMTNMPIQGRALPHLGLLFALLMGVSCSTTSPPSAAPQPQSLQNDDRSADVAPGPAQTVSNDPCGKRPIYPVKLSNKFPSAVPKMCFGRPEQRQRNFDFFGWQEFVALNWPADDQGAPKDKSIGKDPSARRVWQGFMGPSAVFLRNGKKPSWKPGAGMDTTSFLDATHFPVVDRDGNFVVFSMGMNRVMFNYIVKNNLYSKAGQKKFKCEPGTDKRPIEFPAGSVEVKAAWRIFPENPSPNQKRIMARYYHYKTRLSIPKDNSQTGRPLNPTVNLALIGFHIAQKTKRHHQWTWATYEHRDNLMSWRKIPSTFKTESGHKHENLPPIPKGARPNPDDRALKPYNKPYIWAQDMKQGYAAPNKWIPTVIRREVSVQSDKHSPFLNAQWQFALSGSPWANYFLISVQWPVHPSPPICKQAKPKLGTPFPEKLANIPLEVYNQSERHGVPESSCIGCHSKAGTTNGDYADFSYLLQFAK